MFRFFIWKCVKSRTIKKVLIPSREAKFIFCSWHLCHHHYNYYYHPFKIETLKWKWNLFLFLFFYTSTPTEDVFVCLYTLSVKEWTTANRLPSQAWVRVSNDNTCDVCLDVFVCLDLRSERMMVLYHCDR